MASSRVSATARSIICKIHPSSCICVNQCNKFPETEPLTSLPGFQSLLQFNFDTLWYSVASKSELLNRGIDVFRSFLNYSHELCHVYELKIHLKGIEGDDKFGIFCRLATDVSWILILRLILFFRYSSWTYRTRAFPHLRGNDNPAKTRPASKGEQILSEI